MKHPVSSARFARRFVLTAFVASTAAICGMAALSGLAFAEGSAVAKISALNSAGAVIEETESADISNAMSAASSYAGKANVSSVTITLMRDWDTSSYGRITIPEGKSYTFNLEGHMINRGLASIQYSGKGSGEVITVSKNATLVVNGGDKSTVHHGTLYDSQRFWKYDLAGSADINGGLITGGASDDSKCAGGITMSSDGSVKVTLNDVTVAGNVQDAYLLTHGDGGGIYVGGKSSMLELNGSKVMYNHAENSGAGIYINGNSSTVNIKNGSEVSCNKSKSNGAGIYHNGKEGSVNVEASKISSNLVSNGDGGGIYDYYNDTVFNFDKKSMVFDNIASHYGGGIYLNDRAAIKLDNESSVYGNQAKDGAGIYIDDDESKVTMDNGAKIERNVASNEGGGIYVSTYETTISLSGPSTQICNNSAAIGGGISVNYMSATIRDASTYTCVYLNKGAGINNNSASRYGGGFVFDTLGTCFIKSDDMGYICNNSADTAGGLWKTGDLGLENITISGNFAKTQAGGVLVHNPDNRYIKLYASETVVIDGNYTLDAARSNAVLEYHGYLTHTSYGKSGDAPSAKSRIGITAYEHTGSYNDTVADSSFTKNILGKWEDVLYADDSKCSLFVNKGGSYVRYSEAPTAYDMSIFADKGTGSKKVACGTEVVLDSADYANDGQTLDYWEVSGLKGVSKLEPVDGKATFTMPEHKVILEAHYSDAITQFSAVIEESAAWDALGGDVSTASVGSFRMTVDGAGSSGVTTTEEIRKSVKVDKVSVVNTSDGKKKLTYTVGIGKSVLGYYGYYFDEGFFDTAAAEVRTSFGRASDAAATLTQNEDGSLVLTATVVLEKPDADTVTVNTVNTNRSKGSSFDTVVDAVDGQKGSETGTDTTVAVEVPDEPGWSFVGWQNLPSGAIEDSVTHTITADASQVAGSEITALYKPLASAVAITVDKLEVGKAFPTTITSCRIAGANERDLTSIVKPYAKVTWKKLGGLDAGDVVEPGEVYEATIKTDGDVTGYFFGFDEKVYTTVNGAQASSVELLDASGTQSVSYYEQTAADESYAGLVADLPALRVSDAASYASQLPSNVVYRLASGDVQTAAVVWDTASIDVSAVGDSFEVKGAFEDAQGDSHDVTQSVVVASEISLADAVVSAKASYAYTGRAITPVTVTCNGKKLVEGQDYQIVYENNIKVGYAVATVTGKGNYVGKTGTAFTIKPAKVASLKVKAQGKGKLKVTWKKASAKAARDGVRVRYAASKAKLKAGKGTVVKAKGTAAAVKTIKKLKSGKKCYVQVRAYKKGTDGVTYCSAWSKVKAVKAK